MVLQNDPLEPDSSEEGHIIDYITGDLLVVWEAVWV